MRCQFVLDERTNKLLDDLASGKAGNRSYVVREAIQVYAALESALEEAEADPAFLKMMERSVADIRAGRVYSHDEAKKRLSTSKRKRCALKSFGRNASSKCCGNCLQRNKTRSSRR